MTLLTWDLHTGAVLGRPTSIDFRLVNRSTPIDVVLPNEKKKMPLVPRGDHDPPTPLTRAIWGFEMMRPLREILDLEKEGPFPKDFDKVDRLHQKLLDIQARTPAPFRLENPDTRFDDLPDCWWLPLTRPSLPQLMAFNFMALHRPYIFTRAVSRAEALRASISMLEAQRIYFSVMKPHQFKTFALFFGTFDAVVMLASIYILFPREHADSLPATVRHLRWAVERFELMAERNKLAQAALGVLNAIHTRFKKAVGAATAAQCPASCEQMCRGAACALSKSSPGVASTSASDSTPSQTPHSASTNNTDASRYSSAAPSGRGSNSSGGGGAPTTIPTTSSSGGSIMDGGRGQTPASAATAVAAAAAAAAATTNDRDADSNSNSNSNNNNNNNSIFDTPDWTFPTDFDFSTIMPMYPIGDVAYNDLTGILATTTNSNNNVSATATPATGWSDGTTLSPGTTTAAMHNGGMSGGGGLQQTMSGQDQNMQSQGQPWQFGGDFGNDTIWNLLNQLPY